MTITEHDLRCPELTDPGEYVDPARCTCRDLDGHTRRTSWADGPLCAFDLESTSANPEEARIVTATVVRIRPGRAAQITNWLTDVAGVEIPEAAAKTHGVTTEHARKHGRPMADVVTEVRVALELEWRAGIPVVGHNLSYDFTLLAAEVGRAGDKPFTVSGAVIDTIVLDRGVGRYRRGKRTLAAACEHYGITLDNAHTSDADALASARVAFKIARRYPQVGEMPLPELHEWQRAAHLVWAEHFGQYLQSQGKPDDVSRGWPMRRGDAA